MVICLEQGADLHMAQLMSLPLTISCLRKIQIGRTSLVLAYQGSPGQRAVKWMCVCCTISGMLQRRFVDATTYSYSIKISTAYIQIINFEQIPA